MCQTNKAKGCLVKASTTLLPAWQCSNSLGVLRVSSSFYKPGTASPPVWWCIGLGILEYTHVISTSGIESHKPNPAGFLLAAGESSLETKRQYYLLLKVLPALLALQVMHAHTIQCGQKSVGIGQPREGGAGH